MSSAVASTSINFGSIEPTETLYFFDEPLIFCAGINTSPVLCIKTDESKNASEYLVVPTSEEVLRDLKEGKISVRAAFDQPWGWIVKTDGDYNSVSQHQVCPNKLGQDYLPEPGNGLYEFHGHVPDRFSVEQEKEDAFFVVRFKGGQLKSETMNFSVFKSLVDGVYNSLRDNFISVVSKAVNNRVSENMIWKLLYIPVREPQFASLELRIDAPRLQLNLNRKLEKELAVNVQHIKDDLLSSGKDFVQEAGKLQKIASRGNLSVENISKYLSSIEAISQIVPHEDSAFESVEFIAKSFDGETEQVLFERSTGQKIRSALKESRKVELHFNGKVVETNSRSNSFIIKTNQGREMTCKLIDAKMHILMPKILNGLQVEVRGKFERRKRRDSLDVVSIRFADGSVFPEAEG